MEYFSSNQVEQILEGAIKILQEIGLRVMNETYLERLSKKGLDVTGDRIKIHRSRALEQLNKQKGEDWEPERVRPFNTHISAYSNTYERIDGSGFDSITDESNIKMGQFVNNVTKIWPGLSSNAPGHPTDIPEHLQFFKQSINSFTWCENYYSMEPVSIPVAPYQFEVCEVMGRPMEGLPIYLVSPLTIAGESLEIAVSNAHRLKSVWVSSMPSFGANTPLNLIAAYSQTVAETLGGAVIYEELTGVPSYFGANLFTFDMYAMSMPFGTPEKLLLEFMNNELGCKLTGRNVVVSATDIHTNAPRSGLQAAVEKASLAMAGALRGAQSFGCSGTLGMDELFSPVQLLFDLEMLAHIERIIDGMPMDDFDGDLIAEVRDGIERGYIQSDRTLDNYEGYLWHSKLFTRESFGYVIKNNIKDATQKAKDLASSIMATPPCWRLDDHREKEINHIYLKACKAVGNK